MIPPKYLFHGTSEDYIDLIQLQGLKAITYDKVFLASDCYIALQYAKYRIMNQQCNSFTPVVLVIDALQMYIDGFTFEELSYGEYVVKNVPPEYIIDYIVDDEELLLAQYAQKQL